MSDQVAVIIGLCLLGGLVVLAAAESALNAISTSRAEALVEDGASGAERLAAGLVDRRRLLAPILILSLGSQLTLGALVAIVVERRWGGPWVPLGLAILLLSMFVIAESVPKTWALLNIDRVAPAAASLSRGFLAIPPLRWLMLGLGSMGSGLLRHTTGSSGAFTSEEEIVAITDAAVAAKVLDVDEGQMIQSIVDFGDTIVREVMVARPDVLSASADITIDEAIAMMVERGVSRMPIYGADIDDIQGIVHIKDLFARMQRGRGGHFVSIVQRKPVFVPETKRAADLLREIKGVRSTMVVVIDEYGGMAGIVTMEDLIEEFLGEIVDEFDAEEEPLLEPLVGGQWRVHGRIPIDEFNELIGAELPDDDWDTIGGLIFDALGHVPKLDEEIQVDGFLLTVEAIEGRRITRVRVVRASATAADEQNREMAQNE